MVVRVIKKKATNIYNLLLIKTKIS